MRTAYVVKDKRVDYIFEQRVGERKLLVVVECKIYKLTH